MNVVNVAQTKTVEELGMKGEINLPMMESMLHHNPKQSESSGFGESGEIS